MTVGFCRSEHSSSGESREDGVGWALVVKAKVTRWWLDSMLQNCGTFICASLPSKAHVCMLVAAGGLDGLDAWCVSFRSRRGEV